MNILKLGVPSSRNILILKAKNAHLQTVHLTTYKSHSYWRVPSTLLHIQKKKKSTFKPYNLPSNLFISQIFMEAISPRKPENGTNKTLPSVNNDIEGQVFQELEEVEVYDYSK